VYGDGRVVTATCDDEYRPGAPPRLDIGQLADEQLADLVQAPWVSGLFGRQTPDFGSPQNTYLGSTSATFLTPDGERRIVSA